MINLAGEKIHRLTVMRPTQQRQSRSVIWECLCECGNIAYVSSRNLRGKRLVKSCGCLLKENAYKMGKANKGGRKGGRKPLDIAGQKFTYLTALSPTKERGLYNKSIIWRCRCVCGKIKHAPASQLKKGRMKSCGCKTREMKAAGGRKGMASRWGKGKMKYFSELTAWDEGEL